LWATERTATVTINLRTIKMNDQIDTSAAASFNAGKITPGGLVVNSSSLEAV